MIRAASGCRGMGCRPDRGLSSQTIDAECLRHMWHVSFSNSKLPSADVIAITQLPYRGPPVVHPVSTCCTWTVFRPSEASEKGSPAADLRPIDSADIFYVMPANDNVWTKDRLSARRGALLRRLIALHSFTWLPLEKPMSNVVRSTYQAASQELITKLVKAGYLQTALRNDADAITTAIARLKEDLRGGAGDSSANANRGRFHAP